MSCCAGAKRNETEANTPLVVQKKIPFKLMDMHAQVFYMLTDPTIEDYILSNTKNTIISFNAHADLIIPPEMQFKTKLGPSDSKQRLFDDLGTQSWIKELAEKMSTLNVIWIKPPWTKGVDDGHSSFNVKDESNGN